MTVPRKAPYVWTTWITKLLAQENHCEWAAWFQAHYQQYERAESDFPLEQWREDHDRMVKEQTAALRADGFMVFVEDANAFRLTGNNGGTLAGKPDIVALRGDQGIVIDCKTGQRRDSDQQQVLIYMRALPLCHPQYRGLSMEGRVQYRDGKVELGLDKLDHQFDTNLRAIMNRIIDQSVPERMPSSQECRYCNITKSDCPDRIEPLSVKHDVF